MNRLLWGAAVILLTLLGYWLFPGHTYLQSDTQIYIPMLERLNDPALFSNDIVALRPHLAFTIYDETALALKRITSADFQWILTAEQLVFRALAICGLILIALRLGLGSVEAFFVAAAVSLGATISGPAVLTIEYEPVPRGFAIALIVFALGLIARERYFAASVAAGLAFLYHPPTALPLWGLAILLVIAKRIRWTILTPLAAAGLILAVLAWLQPPGIESASMLRRLSLDQEALEKFRASYSFVSTWITNVRIGYVVQALIAAITCWRLRKSIDGPLKDFLWGLPLIGIACIPLSYLLLEREHWAFTPEWQPARAILFLSLIAALLCSIAALKTANYTVRFLWLTAAFLMPIQHAMVGRHNNWKPLMLAAALAILATVLSIFKKPAWVLAALIPFVAIPQSKLVENYPRIETTDLRQMSDWARGSTPPSALFLFPDSGTSLDPGIFRARSLRGLYVDWKSGGQVNYFPEFARLWWKRWVETGSGRWPVKPQDFSKLKAMGVDYVVMKKPIQGLAPLYGNASYSAYSTTSSPGSQ
jgi:hypothetical protein